MKPATRWHAVFRNRLEEIRERSFKQQRYRASGLNLVTAAVVLRNTVDLRRGRRMRCVAMVMPSMTRCFNTCRRWVGALDLTDDCLRRSSAKLGADQFRPLRQISGP